MAWEFEETIGAIKEVYTDIEGQTLLLEMEAGANLKATIQTASISIPLLRKEYCKKVTELLREKFGNELYPHEIMKKGIVEDKILIPMPFRIFPGTNITIYHFYGGIYYSAVFEAK